MVPLVFQPLALHSLKAAKKKKKNPKDEYPVNFLENNSE